MSRVKTKKKFVITSQFKLNLLLWWNLNKTTWNPYQCCQYRNKQSGGGCVGGKFCE